MKRILFLTNYASPYRVHFFDELGKLCDVTVLFSERIEDKKHRDASWFVSGQGRAHFVQLTKKMASIRGRDLCTDVIGWLKKPWDAIVVCGYSSPTVVLAMCWLRMHRVPFYMEVDGGLVRQDGKIRFLVKKWLVTRPTRWLSSGTHTTEYLVHYGAARERVAEYPFSSLWQSDLADTVPDAQEKEAIRQKLGMTEKKIILTIGQFIPRKGFDILLEACRELDDDTGVYFVGGQPTEEYLETVKRNNLSHVHFVGFQNKQSLAEYYRAADVYAMPTREDIWGLVINEAMAYGLPVVTTDRCVAGLDLVENGVNGYIVPVCDAHALAEKLQAVLEADCAVMGAASLEKIRPYTIENMAKTHASIFCGQE